MKILDYVKFAIIVFGATAPVVAQSEGMDFFQKGNYLKAIDAFETQLLSSKNFNEGLYFYLGDANSELGALCRQLYEASCHFGSQYYEKLAANNPRNPLFAYFYGLYLLGAGEKDKARQAFQKAAGTKQSPYGDYAQIWLNVLNGSGQKVRQSHLQLELAVASLESGKNSATGPDKATEGLWESSALRKG